MGVTGLWSLLSSTSNNDVALSGLSGLTVAVDLSQWICELKKIQIAQTIPNLYLRNLFFRTTHLMRHGIKLVFVEDGTAPEIKRAVLSKRNPRGAGSLDRMGMQQYNEKCRELINLLGLPCVQSTGEAESLCAQLNNDEYVDAVLLGDGDAFLYGAKTVYRNLNKEAGTVECCDMRDIKKKLAIDRRGLVAIALLTGCDYGKEGVQHVGIQKARKFVQICNKRDVDPLTRIMSWRSNNDLSSLQKIKGSSKKKLPHCMNCKHLGIEPDHAENGCKPCKTEQSCDQDNPEICTCDGCNVEHEKFESNLREKALKDPAFPDQRLVDEFLNNSQPLPVIKWKSVNVSGLCSFMKKNLRWTDKEFFNKISDLLVTFQLNGLDSSDENKLVPERIVKKCTQKWIPSVVVEWRKLDIDHSTDGFQEVTVSEENFKKHYQSMLDEFNRKEEEEKQKKIKDKKQNQKGRKRKMEENKGQTTLMGYYPVKKKVKEKAQSPDRKPADN